MNECVRYRNLFIESFYNEIEPDNLKILTDHLKQCSECRNEYNKMKSVLDVMSKKKNDDPEHAYWESYYERLVKRIKCDTSIEQEKKTARRISGIIKQWSYRIIGAAAMIAIGVFIGYRYHEQPRPVDSDNGESARLIEQTTLTAKTTRYLERSKILLLGIVNFNYNRIDPSTIDFSYQQKVSRDLINDAGVLKKELKESDKIRLLTLVSDLEMILLQISNYEKQFDIPAIDLIRSGVNNQGILMKINLEEMNLSGRLDQKKADKNVKINSDTNL